MDTWGSGGTGLQVGILHKVMVVETLQKNYSSLH